MFNSVYSCKDGKALSRSCRVTLTKLEVESESEEEEEERSSEFGKKGFSTLRRSS